MLHVTYADGTGCQREVLQSCTALGFQILGSTTEAAEHGKGGVTARIRNDQAVAGDPKHVEVELESRSLREARTLKAALSALPGGNAVFFDDENE